MKGRKLRVKEENEGAKKGNMEAKETEIEFAWKGGKWCACEKGHTEWSRMVGITQLSKGCSRIEKML